MIAPIKLLIVACTFFISSTLFASSLTDNELALLKQQPYVLKLSPNNNTGTIVFDVNEDIDRVFNKIIDFKRYPNLIDEIEKVDVYQTQANIVKVNFYVSEFFISFNNHVIHQINPQNHSVTWTLDPNKKNYFKQMNGAWHLQRVNNKTRVFYSNQLVFDGWAPSFLKNYLFESGLVDSTKWLRKP